MKNVTWIKVVVDGMDNVLEAVDTLKGKVVAIGNMVQVTGISRYDEKQVDILEANGFTMVEDMDWVY